MESDYDNRNLDARGNTKTVIDRSLRISHARFMITPDQILREMHRWVADRRLLQKDIAAELGIAVGNNYAAAAGCAGEAAE